MSPTSILIIAHAPLAHALRECALHVFADCGSSVAALDVQPNQPPEESLAQARIMLDQLGTDTTLVLTDVFGATPSNGAQRLAGDQVQVLSGVSVPMLWRSLCYASRTSLTELARCAAQGAATGVVATPSLPSAE